MTYTNRSRNSSIQVTNNSSQLAKKETIKNKGLLDFIVKSSKLDDIPVQRGIQISPKKED